MNDEQADYINNLRNYLEGVLLAWPRILWIFLVWKMANYNWMLKMCRFARVVHEALSFYAPLAATKTTEWYQLSNRMSWKFCRVIRAACRYVGNPDQPGAPNHGR